MVRLRNVVTGVIVNVRDGKVLAGYVPAEEPEKAPAAKRAPAIRKSAK